MTGAEGGIRLVRQTFGQLLPKGWNVAQAYLNYKHDHDVEWQVLTFHVIGPDGKVIVIDSDKVPARDDVNLLAEKTAQQFIEGRQKDGTLSADAGDDLQKRSNLAKD